MTKRSLILKIIAIANAVFITTAFVGCPARSDPRIDPQIVTIAAPRLDFQHLVPIDQTLPLPTKDPKNDKLNP